MYPSPWFEILDALLIRIVKEPTIGNWWFGGWIVVYGNKLKGDLSVITFLASFILFVLTERMEVITALSLPACQGNSLISFDIIYAIWYLIENKMIGSTFAYTVA